MQYITHYKQDTQQKSLFNTLRDIHVPGSAHRILENLRIRNK
jgi:hypothetical protein